MLSCTGIICGGNRQLIIIMQDARLSSLISSDTVYGDFFKDELSIDFPLKKFVRVRTEGVSNKEVDYTIHKVLEKQRTSKVGPILLIVLLCIIGLFIAYVGLILWIVTFLNPFLLSLEVVLIIKYFIWMVRAVGMRILKKQKKNVEALLESENKRFYFRKLIKWKLDAEENKILLQNLRG